VGPTSWVTTHLLPQLTPQIPGERRATSPRPGKGEAVAPCRPLATTTLPRQDFKKGTETSCFSLFHRLPDTTQEEHWVHRRRHRTTSPPLTYPDSLVPDVCGVARITFEEEVGCARSRANGNSSSKLNSGASSRHPVDR
jgi:hypothetical protein